MKTRSAFAVLALAASLAACSSSSKDTGTTGTAGGDGSTADAVPAAQGKAIDVCSVLSAATAAKLSGQPYTTAAPEKGDWQSQCAYNNDDATAQGVNVTLWDTNAENTWNTVHTGSFTDVSGLGDKALWDNDNTLYVLTGADLLQVNGLEDQGKAQALAEPVLAALH